MLIAQGLGEYAGGSGGVAAELGALVQTTVWWVQMSLREHRGIWIAAAVCFGWWALKRR